MRIKILALFVAIQFGSFLLWQQVNGGNTVIAPVPQGQTHAVAQSGANHVHFASRNTQEKAVDLDGAIIEKSIREALVKLPVAHAESVQEIIVDYSAKAHRGLGGKQMIILRGDMPQEEMTGVLVHEVAHNVDLVALQAKENQDLSGFYDGEAAIYVGDPSVDFYRISWTDEGTRKNTANNMDFVSGYAMSDAFEDFAETYAYYVLHNRDFKSLTSSSPALFAKWRFMKYRVFNGVEFNTGKADTKSTSRPWDVTVLPYDLTAFLSQ